MLGCHPQFLHAGSPAAVPEGPVPVLKCFIVITIDIPYIKQYFCISLSAFWVYMVITNPWHAGNPAAMPGCSVPVLQWYL